MTSGNYILHTFMTTSRHDWGRYFFLTIDMRFREIKPDIIYIVHEESAIIHHQVYRYRDIYAPKAKIIFFSMNALGVPYQPSNNPLKNLVRKLRWSDIKTNTEAALVHFPGCMKSLRDSHYIKPIFLQTQVGVDETLFKYDISLRNTYRKKLKLSNSLVIGFCGRIVAEKGVDDIFKAFVELANKFPEIVLLLVGNGSLAESIKIQSEIKGISDRVHITGYVNQDEVPGYMNSMDIFTLGSKTTANWTDTFPLVTVQAQATKLPVVASTSGSLPWQLADSAILYSESDPYQLSESLRLLINDKNYESIIAKKDLKYPILVILE